MVRPKIYFDTNICIDLANGNNGNIDPNEWNRVRRYIREKYRYCISFITVKELFAALARGSEEFFSTNKQPLEILYGCGKREFLPYPFAFALQTVLQVRHEDLHSEPKDGARLKKMVEVVLDASTKDTLERGIPDRRRRGKFLTFDLDDFDSVENGPQKEFAKILEGIRDGTIDAPDPRKWSAWLLAQYKMTPYSEQCDALSRSLDAAYQHTVFLAALAKNRNYNFAKQESHWGDVAQLFYLCDERMHFLTSDTEFLSAAKGSTQSSRILLYRDFVQRIPTGC